MNCAFLLSAVIALTNEFGSVEVDTRGALVTSYVPRGGLPYGEGTYEVFDRGNGRRLSLSMIGSNKLILWNIGPNEKMAGLEGDDWRRYLCIEPAVIPRADGFYLNPGETRTIGMICTCR